MELTFLGLSLLLSAATGLLLVRKGWTANGAALLAAAAPIAMLVTVAVVRTGGISSGFYMSPAVAWAIVAVPLYFVGYAVARSAIFLLARMRSR